MKQVTERDNIENYLVLEKYNKLVSQGLEPKMAVYRGKRLTIHSKKTSGFLQKIASIFKSSINKILFLFRILKNDPKRIEYLKQSVKNYNSQKYRALVDSDSQELENSIQEKRLDLNNLKLEIESLSVQKQELSDEVNNREADLLELETKNTELTDGISSLEEELRALRERENQINQLLETNQGLQEANDDLENQIRDQGERLEILNGDCENRRADLDDLNQEIPPLRREVNNLREDREQLNYKLRCEELSNRVDQLILEQENIRRKAYDDGLTVGSSTVYFN